MHVIFAFSKRIIRSPSLYHITLQKTSPLSSETQEIPLNSSTWRHFFLCTEYIGPIPRYKFSSQIPLDTKNAFCCKKIAKSYCNLVKSMVK